MEELDKYLNKCYLEKEKDNIFVYKFVKIDGKYGFLCYEAQIKPCEIYIYEDFPDDQEGSIGFIRSFIPELDKECEAKEISEGYYYELVSKIEKLNLLQETVNQQIKNFIKDGLDKEI